MGTVIIELWQKAKTEGLKQALSERKGEVHAYLAPSDEPLTYDTSGVVRLDVAVHAIRLATARIAMRSLPGMFRQKMAALKRSLIEFAGQKVVGFLLIAAAKRLLSVMVFVGEFFQRVKLETELESAIRRGVLRTMREIPKLKMRPKKGGKRVLKRVASRHGN